MNHTPGPWTSGKYTVNAEHRVICRLMPEYGLTTKGEDEANGRLMAAAPDLLVACETALDWIMEDANIGPCEILRVAIAKAKGDRS